MDTNREQVSGQSTPTVFHFFIYSFLFSSTTQEKGTVHPLTRKYAHMAHFRVLAHPYLLTMKSKFRVRTNGTGGADQAAMRTNSIG